MSDIQERGLFPMTSTLATREQERQQKTASQSYPVAAEPTRDDEPINILVVDDEPKNLTVLETPATG
jgi:hypothetical protein